MSITQITFVAEGSAPQARRQTRAYLLVEQVKKAMLAWPSEKPEMIIPFSLAFPPGASPAVIDATKKKAQSEASALLRALKANLKRDVYDCWKATQGENPCVVIAKAKPKEATPPKRR